MSVVVDLGFSNIVMVLTCALVVLLGAVCAYLYWLDDRQEEAEHQEWAARRGPRSYGASVRRAGQ